MMDGHALGDHGEIIPSNDTYYEDYVAEKKNMIKNKLCNFISAQNSMTAKRKVNIIDVPVNLSYNTYRIVNKEIQYMLLAAKI